MNKTITAWLIFFSTLSWYHALAQPDRPTIVFLLLKMTKDSTTGIDSIRLIEKVKSPGQIKRPGSAGGAAGLSKLPYLSLRFYKGKTLLDSARYEYPLRERLQNTRENVQGYKDIEIRSKEFFFRFQQNEADLLEIYKISDRNKRKLIAIDLR